MIGRGPLEAELREIAVASGVADRVTLPRRRMDDDELRVVPRRRRLLPAERGAQRGVRPRADRGARGRHAGRLDRTCPRACRTPTSTASPGSPCRVGDVAALAAALQPAARRRRAARSASAQQARERALTQFTIPRMVDAMLRRLRRGAEHPRGEAGEGVDVAQPLHRALGRSSTRSSSTRGFVLAFLLRLRRRPAGVQLRRVPRARAAHHVLATSAAAWTYGLYEPERTETAWAVVARGRRRRVTSARCSRSRSRSSAARAPRRSRVPTIAHRVRPRSRRCSSAGAWCSCASAASRWPEQRVLIVGTGAVSVELADELVAPRASGAGGSPGLIDPAREARCARRRRDAAASRCSGTRHDIARLAARARRQPRHRRQPGRAARARRVARARRRGPRARRRRARALRDLHRHRRRHRRRHPAHGDHALDRAALLRRRQARHRPRRRRCCCSSLAEPRSCSSPRSRSSLTDGLPGHLLAGAQRQEPQAVPRPQAPHDGQGRREALRPGACRGGRPAHHARRPLPAHVPHRRAAAARQHPRGRDELRRSAARAARSSSSSSATRFRATASASASSRASPGSRR